MLKHIKETLDNATIENGEKIIRGYSIEEAMLLADNLTHQTFQIPGLRSSSIKIQKLPSGNFQILRHCSYEVETNE